MLRIRNTDTHKRARKNDTIDAAQNAPTHHTNEKKIQKDRETKRQDQRRKDTNDIVALATKAKTGKAQTLTKTRTADVSFENDTEEEINTTEIEEKVWVDYIKRSTNDAMEKMGNAKIRCWNKTHKK